MIWNNKKLEELRNLNNKEAQSLFDEYDKKINESKNKNNPGPNDITDLYKEKENQKLLSYKIIVGDLLLPITPKDLNFENKTEEKKYKNIYGQELIIGVIILPRVVKFKSFFPYYKIKSSDKEPIEYIEYFENIKNSGKTIEFKIEGSDISFEAYIIEFNYKLIPGRDIEFDMSLKEFQEVREIEIDI